MKTKRTVLIPGVLNIKTNLAETKIGKKHLDESERFRGSRSDSIKTRQTIKAQQSNSGLKAKSYEALITKSRGGSPALNLAGVSMSASKSQMPARASGKAFTDSLGRHYPNGRGGKK